MVFWPGAWPSCVCLGFRHEGRRRQWMPVRLPCLGCRAHAGGRSCSLSGAIHQEVHQTRETCGISVTRWSRHLPLHLGFGWLVALFIVSIISWVVSSSLDWKHPEDRSPHTCSAEHSELSAVCLGSVRRMLTR